jgi:hypothetical protein
VDKRCGGKRKGLDLLIPNDLHALNPSVVKGLSGLGASCEENNGFDNRGSDEMDGEPRFLSERTGSSGSEAGAFN